MVALRSTLLRRVVAIRSVDALITVPSKATQVHLARIARAPAAQHVPDVRLEFDVLAHGFPLPCRGKTPGMFIGSLE